MKWVKNIIAYSVEMIVFVSIFTVTAFLIEFVFEIKNVGWIMFGGLAVGLIGYEIAKAFRRILQAIFEYKSKKKPPFKDGVEIKEIWIYDRDKE